MTRSPMYDRLEQIDTTSLTTADVADMLGVSADRAGEMMRYLGKAFIRRPPSGRAPCDLSGFPVPLRGDTEVHWQRLLSGRSYGDHTRAAPPQAIARLSGPALTHTAGGVGW